LSQLISTHFMMSSLRLVISVVICLGGANSSAVSSIHEAARQETLRSEMLGGARIAAGMAAKMATKRTWAKHVGENQEAVELLRFITGYKTGLDSFVDVTPMTPMLEKEQVLKVYSYIETWVGNDTINNQAYFDNVTQRCSKIRGPDKDSQGNGWSLSVDLGFTPPKKKDMVHPRKVVPLISNAMFADAGFGKVAVHEVFYDGHSLTASGSEADPDQKKFRAFEKDVSSAVNATVFRCDGGNDLLQKLSVAAAAQKFVSNPSAEDALMQELFQSNLRMVDVHPLTTTSRYHTKPNEIVVTYKPSDAHFSPGLDVYFSDAVTDTWLASDEVWLNTSTPFKSMGSVVSVDNGTAVLSFSTSCMPSAANSWLPKLRVPESKEAIDIASKFARDARDLAKRKGRHLKEAASHIGGKHLGEAVNGDVIIGTLLLEEFAGHIDLKSLRDGDKKFRPQLTARRESEGASTQIGKVCVITEQAPGRLVDTFFDLPKISKGERVVVQFTATGHGWASTEEQCGEFCKMRYNVSFDGHKPAEFMHWRDDCNKNPTGQSQYGTWWEPRNGWCPGSVNDGVYFDITDSLKKDLTTQHHLAIDISVLNSNSGVYEPYSNLKGWLNHDPAMLNVDMKLFIYPPTAVKAAQSIDKSCSKVHATFHAGSGKPVGARWPQNDHHDMRQSEEAPEHEVSGTKAFLKGSDQQSNKGPSCSIDFEAAAPWHLFKSDEVEQEVEEITWVSLLKNRLVQGDSQTQFINVNRTILPAAWGQVGLRLRLERPGGGLDFDHWDRLGSVGLVVDRPVPVALAKKRPYTSYWAFMSYMSYSVLVLFALVVSMLFVTINTYTSRERWSSSVTMREAKPIRLAQMKLQSDEDQTYGTVPLP